MVSTVVRTIIKFGAASYSRHYLGPNNSRSIMNRVRVYMNKGFISYGICMLAFKDGNQWSRLIGDEMFKIDR